jgi:hypothetical protein
MRIKPEQERFDIRLSKFIGCHLILHLSFLVRCCACMAAVRAILVGLSRHDDLVMKHNITVAVFFERCRGITGYETAPLLQLMLLAYHELVDAAGITNCF